MRRSLTMMSMIVLAVLCATVTGVQAAPTDGLLDSVIQQGRKDAWKWPFVGIDVAGTRYVCSMADGKIVGRSKSQSAAVVDGWAAVGVVPLDAQKKDAAQGAGWLMRRAGTSWQRKALDEGVGYSRASLTKAGIPPATVKKLGLTIAD